MLILKPSGGPLSWRAIHEARAVALAELSSSWVTAFFHEFGDASFSDTVSGTGTVTDASLRGGVAKLDTGTSNSTAQAHNGSLRVLVGNAKTDHWYVATRAQITTTPDSQTIWVPAGLSASFFDLDGSVSTTTYQIVVGGVPTATTATVDTGWHDFALSYNGTTLTAWLDGVSVGSVANTNIAATAQYFSTLIYNQATAATQTGYLDSAIVVTDGQ